MKQTYITEQLYPPFTPTLHLFVHFPVVFFRKNQFKFSFAFISIIIINTIKFIKDETKQEVSTSDFVVSLSVKWTDLLYQRGLCVCVWVYLCKFLLHIYLFFFSLLSNSFFHYIWSLSEEKENCNPSESLLLLLLLKQLVATCYNFVIVHIFYAFFPQGRLRTKDFYASRER